MKKEKYIITRKKKYGKAFQIYINFKDSSGRDQVFSQTIRSCDYLTVEDAFQAAKIIRDKALLDIRTNTLVKRFPTVKELYQDMKELLVKSVNTYRKLDFIYNQVLKPIENTTINEITVAMIQKSLNDYSRNHTQDMVNRALSIWRQIYKVAQMRELPIPDKTLQIVRPKSKVPPKRKTVEITDEDFFRFCDALLNYGVTRKGKHLSKVTWYMLMIMYYTGMRPSEVFALHRKDINLLTSEIRIKQAVGSDLDQTGVIVPTKTELSSRIVPICQELHPILQQLLKWSNNDFPFTDINGNLLDTTSVSDHIRLVSKKCGIEFRSYMLRHKFATDLINSGASARTTQDLMGHSSFSMSLSYARSSKEDRKKAIKNRHFS